jgi:divalent metal cation (Fe/Co/Zn/Cd) transporter
MSIETDLQKLKQDYPELFREVPPEIIDFALSDKTSEKISDIAVKNSINKEEEIEGIAQRITWVLLNKLPKENLAMTLELGLNLTPDTAKKIADEANQFISSVTIKLKTGSPILLEKETQKEEPQRKEESQKPLKSDTYREPIE